MVTAMQVNLLGLASALPPHVLPQDLVLENAREILGPRYAQFERLVPAFTNAGVAKRHAVEPLEWYRAPQSWQSRNESYLRGASALFETSARRALADAGLRPDEVDTIVTVSSTGVATPTLEARVSRGMGFRRDVRRVPLFGLGCAGGVSGLSVAQTLAEARPGTNVLLVAVECCTLSFRSDRLQKADIIATVLFGDGAAAAIVSTNAPGVRPGARDAGARPRIHLARHAAHHGLGRGRCRARRRLRPLDPRLRPRAFPRGCRRLPRPRGAARARHRPLGSATLEARRCWRRWKRRWSWSRAAWTTSAPSCRRRATCPLPPSCSCSNARSRPASRARSRCARSVPASRRPFVPATVVPAAVPAEAAEATHA